jgi:endonuclease-3 related protein
VIVGAVLVQNTSWTNVERAIANLREAGLMSPRALFDLPPEELAELIRPAGYFQVKTRRLRNVLRFIIEEYDGSLDALFAADQPTLREQLLSIHGVGPETADAILLYAGEKATFVVDTYTHRLLARHGWIGYDASYEEIKDYFEGGLPADAAQFNEYHALIVRVGKDYCRRGAPKCEECPLKSLLPAGGIVDPI